MSATLSNDDVQKLKSFLQSERCIVLANRDNRRNIKLQIQRYKRCKRYSFAEKEDADESVMPRTSGSTESMWGVAVRKVEKLLEDRSTVCYLDFVRDVDEVVHILQSDGFKVGKYIGEMNVEEKSKVEHNLRQGSILAIVATESYELSVDNPNINQIVRIGCPRNLGVFLQEIGRAGRSPDSTASGMLMVNEYIDDKRLRLWLRSVLQANQDNFIIKEKNKK